MLNITEKNKNKGLRDGQNLTMNYFKKCKATKK